MLDPIKVNNYSGLSLANGANYEIIMPSDYLHLLNCICIYRVKKTFKCYNAGDTWRAPAKRLTADMYSQVLDNFWNKPTYKKPYYYIHNINKSATVPTNPYDGNGHGTDAPQQSFYAPTTDPSTGAVVLDQGQEYGQDAFGSTIINGKGSPEFIKIGNTEASAREKGAELRYGNRSEVRIEIRYGTDDSIFELEKVYVDYIKAPQHIRLTQLQVDFTEDTSQQLEYPDYVCQEIVNELVHLIMENIGEQRLQTHPVVSQSIANPAQAQAPEAAGQTAQ